MSEMHRLERSTNPSLQKKALTTHTNVTHLGRRDHACPHEGCEQTFGYKHLLQRHLAKHHLPSPSPKSSDEDGNPLPQPTAPNMDIDVITGNTYAQNAQEKLKAAKALQCPYPHLNDLDFVRNLDNDGTNDGLACDYVFSRAYDLRRHLHAVHDIVVHKESVDRWALVRWPRGQTVLPVNTLAESSACAPVQAFLQ